MNTLSQSELVEVNQTVTQRLREGTHFLSNLVSMRSSDVYILFHGKFLYFTFREGVIELEIIFSELAWEKAMLSQDNEYIPLDTYLEPIDKLPFDPQLFFDRYDRSNKAVKQLISSPGKKVRVHTYEEYHYDFTYLPFSGIYRLGTESRPAHFLKYINKYHEPNLSFYNEEGLVGEVFKHFGREERIVFSDLELSDREMLKNKQGLLSDCRSILGKQLTSGVVLEEMSADTKYALWITPIDHFVFFEWNTITKKVLIEQFPQKYGLEVLKAKWMPVSSAPDDFVRHPEFGLVQIKNLPFPPVNLANFKIATQPSFWLNMIEPKQVSEVIQSKSSDLHFGGLERSYILKENRELYHSYGRKPLSIEQHLRFVFQFGWFFHFQFDLKR